jgi:hypothetical protein
MRAAARADLDHLDDGDAHGHAGALDEALGARDLEPAGGLRAGVVDQAELGRGAAHVEGEDLGRPGRRRRLRGEDRAARGAGFHQPDGRCARRSRSWSCRRLRSSSGSGRSGPPRETGLEGGKVAGHQRLDIGVGDGGAEPVELPRLGADLVAERRWSRPGTRRRERRAGAARARGWRRRAEGRSRALRCAAGVELREQGRSTAASSKRLRSPLRIDPPPMVKARSRGTIRSGFRSRWRTGCSGVHRRSRGCRGTLRS